MNKLYAIAALFKTPADILKAAAAVRDKGYKNFDTNTPYPVHGLDGAMGLKETTIGRVAFAFGLLGLFLAVVLQGWTSAVDYPLVIGGKPLFSAPAFVPVTFELTVLLASLGVVGILISIYLNLPLNSHPLHDSNYMTRVSSDRFGIYIEAEDKAFDAAEIVNFFKSIGAESTEEIYLVEEEITFKAVLFDKKFIGAMVTIFLGVAVATALHLQVGLESAPLNWLSEQPKYSAQSTSDLFADGSAMRPPVQGTVPRGFIPYAYAKEPDLAGEMLVNPLLPTVDVIADGKRKYEIFCSMCHGDDGRGEGRLKGKFPKPPSLHSTKLREEWSDGRIYHVITVGQNSMPAYDKQIPREDRWAIIRYLRVLQRSLNAKESDLQ